MTVVDAPRTAARTAVERAAGRAVHLVMDELRTTADGLSAREATRRLAEFGPNAVRTRHTRGLSVLWHQVRSPLLGLLLAAAVASYFVGERSDAVIIGVIVAMSVGLGFVNEFRAEKAAEALHSQVRHTVVVHRDGRPVQIEVGLVVPGDILDLRMGDIVAADARLIDVEELECDEALLTGEALPVPKTTESVAVGAALAELSDCVLMGTVVHAGSGRGVVVATGAGTQFGRIAAQLGEHQDETEFQLGLRRFSMLLVYVAAVLTSSIFVTNLLLHRPAIDALLFSLAIAVGITPQLLPAVVSISLAAGSRQMSRRKVLVKRLVCIEDLGDVDMLFTDKTGTLTEGRISFMRPVPANGCDGAEVLRWGLLCSDVALDAGHAVGGNPLDVALWESPAAAVTGGTDGWERLATLPFDHERRMMSTLVRDNNGDRVLVTKGAPETVLDRCTEVPPDVRDALSAEFAAGHRVVAVATREAFGAATVTPAEEQELRVVGLLVFLDPPKQEAAGALQRLASLGIRVRVVTGDSPAVALKVCADLGLSGGQALTGVELDRLDDAQLAEAIATTTVFARVSPEQKARIVQLQRRTGGDVAFLGDGVNDALALHAADVGISVDSATDVAKDAADVILLEKDLGVLADGVAEGRRIFANTIKYVLMGTSSNFGNMFSAAGASLFLKFLPMLPSQILLNNLLYDTGQLTIPSDRVDEEQLRRPSHWDIGFIRRFMLCFGPISSVFDFATFAVMLWGFHASASEFRTGWFVESLATQTLVIFAIRTHRIPFYRSTPSLPLTLSALATVAVGALLPISSLAHVLGFATLPAAFYATLAGMVLAYLVLIEAGKFWFYRLPPPATSSPVIRRRPERHHRRRATTFSTTGRLPAQAASGGSTRSRAQSVGI